MKNSTLLTLGAVGLAALLAAPAARAATLTWDANAATALQTDGAGVWDTAASNVWWNGSANQTWAAGSDAVFGAGGAGGAVALGSSTTVNSLLFNYFTGTYTLGSAGQTITLSNGITRNAGAATVAFASPVTLGADQNWDNNSATQYSVKGGINVNGYTLTIGGIGATDLGDNTANLITGSGAIIKNGPNSLIFNASGTVPNHTFSGSLTINEGRVAFQDANGLPDGNITINGGYLGARYASPLTRNLGSGSGEIQILGGTSGFSGEGSSGSQFQLGGSGSTVVWGSTYFNPSVLILGGDLGANVNGKGSLNNAIDLNGASRTITSLQVTDGAATSGFTVNGAISTSSGTAGLTKTGPGNLILAAANTYNGPTTINGGSITLSGSGTINSSSALALGGGTLRLVNTAQVNRFADGAAITSTGGTLSYENTSGANVYTETLGSVTHSGGQLNIVESVNQAGAGAQTLTLGGLTQSGSAAVTFSALTTGPQASGNKNMIVVTGAGTTTAGEIIGPGATVGTAASVQTDYAVYNANYVVPANITASAESGWSTTHAVGNNYTMLNEAGGATTLTATRNINALRNTSVAANVTVDIASDTVTNIGHTFQNGDVFTFGGTAPGGAANGNVYYVRDVVAGNTFKVAATSGGAAIDLTSAGTPNVTGGITLSSGNNLGTYGILSAAASGLAIGGSGTGVVTLPTTNAGSLYVTPGNGAVITIAVPIADNTASGVLALVKNGSATLRLEGAHTYTGDTIINAGILQVGNNSTATLGGGNYAGNIFIAGGAALTLQGNSANTLSGIISGGGNVNANRGTTTLSSNNTYAGKTTLGLTTPNSVGSALYVSSFNSVNGGTPLLASSSLGCPTTVANGTIDFGAAVQQTCTLQYSGSGEITDRIINFIFNGTGTRVIDSSGNGKLKFTGTPTSNGTGTSHVNLQGSGDGEFVVGLPFAFANFNKLGAGTWTLGGAVGNTGVTTVNAGTLALRKMSSLLGGNMANWTAAKINVKTNATLALNVDAAGSGGFDTNSLNTLLAAISVAGSASAGLQSGARLGFDTSTATGGIFTQGNAIANSTGANGGPIAVTKLGTGTLVFDKANTYTGPTTVGGGILAVGGLGVLSNTAIIVKTNGTLQLDGTAGGGLITVEAGGRLQGVGTAGGTVSVSGTLAPGNSIGTLNIGALSLQSGSEFAAEIDAAISEADLVNANGNLDLTGPVTLNLGNFGADQIMAQNTVLTLISYHGTWNNGLFSGHADDSTFVHGANTYQINYNDTLGGGMYDHDVTLTVIPEPATVGLMGLIGFAAYFRRRMRR